MKHEGLLLPAEEWAWSGNVLSVGKEADTMLVMWTRNLSVGVKRLDEDHKRLLSVVHDLHYASQNVSAEGTVDAEEIEFALHRLENYFKYHCLEENRLMDKTAYPDREAHKLEHTGFLAMIQEKKQRFIGSSKPEDAIELMQFMYDWMTNHINVTDKKFGEHLNTKGIT
jgi:hemerythrin-like metal-binding protein